MKELFRKGTNVLFLILFFGLILSSVLYIFIIKEQQTVSFIENRNLYTTEHIFDDETLDDSFQVKVGRVLEDQFFMRYEIVNGKRKVNYFLTSLIFKISNTEGELTPLNDPHLFRVGDTSYIVTKPMEYEERIETRVKDRLDQYAALQEYFPDRNVYVYHPIQAHETGLFDEVNELETYGVELNQLMIDYAKIPYKSLVIEDLDYYKQHFYSSDHHWNHLGSYIGYRDMLSLLQPETQALEPSYLDCNYKFYGSFSTRTGGILDPSEFCLFQYELSKYSVELDDGKITHLEMYEEFYEQADSFDSWTYLYNLAYPFKGYANIYRSGVNDKVLMVVGDSYMGPVLPLLAQHYGTVYAINPVAYYLKYYEVFDFYSYIEEKQIQDIIFMITIENYFYDDEYGPRYKFNDVIKGDE
jgi:hypothetical protein